MKKKFLAVLLSATLALACGFTSGCTSADFQTALNEVGPAIGVILQIIALSKGTQANMSLQSKVSADTAALNKLYSDFNSAAQANKGSIEGEINAAFAVLQSDLGAVFSLAQVSNQNTQAKLSGLIGLVQSFVQIAENAIPAQAAKLASMPSLNASQVADAWNKVLVAKTGDAKVDAYTASHKYHRHSMVVRALTLGLAH